jgi:hypothetical protein
MEIYGANCKDEMTISVKEIPGYKDIQTECIYE